MLHPDRCHKSTCALLTLMLDTSLVLVLHYLTKTAGIQTSGIFWLYNMFELSELPVSYFVFMLEADHGYCESSWSN